MALRRYKKRMTGADTAPLSEAAKATPRQDTPDAVNLAPLPKAANAAPLENPGTNSMLRRVGQRRAESQSATAASATPQPNADAEYIKSLAS
jgi:hypothetical protein